MNISALSNLTSGITAITGLILVTPNENLGYQPQNPPTNDGTVNQPPNTILFNYEGEQTATLQSDITDHYVEDNTSLQDNISIKPVIITTHGFIGELNDIPPNAALAGLKTVADKLTTVAAFTPQLTLTAQLAYNEASFLYSTAVNAVNAVVSVFSSVNNQTKQQIYFQQFYQYQQNRTLFTVQTPWAIFPNCAIMTLRAIQDESTRMVTDFEVSFKQMRFAKIQNAGGNSAGNAFQGRAAFPGSLLDNGHGNLGPSTPFATSGVV